MNQPSQWTKKTTLTINQSINQPINQLINQSINQSINRSINQSISAVIWDAFSSRCVFAFFFFCAFCVMFCSSWGLVSFPPVQGAFVVALKGGWLVAQLINHGVFSKGSSHMLYRRKGQHRTVSRLEHKRMRPNCIECCEELRDTRHACMV